MRLPEARPSEATWTLLRAHDLEELWEHARSPHVAAAYAARLSLLHRLAAKVLAPGGQVLDVGCAQGTLGLQLAELGHRVTLLDVVPAALEYARARHERGEVEFLEGTLSHPRLSGREFDLVFATEVLEHVKRPSAFLALAASFVRPGGHLVITTPNARYRLSRLPSFGEAPQRVIDEAPEDSQDGDAHRYLYTEGELGALLRGVGLQIEASGSMIPFWLCGHLKSRYLHRLLFSARGRIVSHAPPVDLGTRRPASTFDASLWALASRP